MARGARGAGGSGGQETAVNTVLLMLSLLATFPLLLASLMHALLLQVAPPLDLTMTGSGSSLQGALWSMSSLGDGRTRVNLTSLF